MTEHEESRTLVKSPPELWGECSEAASLARHLDQFGQIRITRLKPETAVAWEGERARGTVRLEPSGWGTRVVLTARALEPEPLPAPASQELPEPEPEPLDQDAPEPARDFDLLPPAGRRRHASSQRGSGMGVVARVWSRFTGRAPAPPVEATRRTYAPAATPDSASAPPQARAALIAALDSLGQAHHRPFSRG
jgi:hypothetical protein